MRWVGALLGILIAAPALAETVSIPFNPPTDEVLRYRSERVTARKQPGQRGIETRLANVTTVRFVRGPGDGWTVTVAPGVDEISGNAPEPVVAAARSMAAATPPLPMEVRLDRQANFLELVNADALMAQARAALSRLRAALPEGLPAEMMDVGATPIIGQSPEAFVEQAVSTFRFAFAGAGQDVQLDTPLLVHERMPMAILGGAEAEFAMTATASLLSPGVVRLAVSGRVDTATLGPQLEAFATQLAEIQPGWRALTEPEKAKQRGDLTEALRRSEMTLDMRIDIDLAAGLPVAAAQSSHIQTLTPAGKIERTETISFIRLP